MSGEYQRAIREAVPDAEICFDPWHVCRLASRATDQVRRDEWNAHDRSHPPTGRWVKGTRWSLLKAPEHQTIHQLATLAEAQTANRRLYRAFLVKEELRLLTTSTTRPWRPSILTPGWPGPAAPGYAPSSAWHARCASTATASSPPPASASPTAASRA
jgi:transposase